MPLHDHFRPPLSTRKSWEGLHGAWPAFIVQQLSRVMPERYSAEPRVHLGAFFEIDVSAYEDGTPQGASIPSQSGGVATAAWAPPLPTATIDADLQDQYEYAVEVYDDSRGRTLVAAIELVSHGNKDRPESRRAFVTKCAALLQQRVCVSIVDLVTTRDFNLYQETLDRVGRSHVAADSTAIYAATCRWRPGAPTSKLETWSYPLAVGQPLPSLPIWLSADLAVRLDLEAAYEDACRILRIS